MRLQYFYLFFKSNHILFYVINIIALTRCDDVPYIVYYLLYLESLNKGNPCERRHF